MTPDRQQLKEALEYRKNRGQFNEHDSEQYNVICAAAQAWYDLPDKLEGMRENLDDYTHPNDKKFFEGSNTAIDEIKEMVKTDC